MDEETSAEIMQEQKLQSENRLQIALKSLKAGAWEWVPGSHFLYWDSKCYELFNQPAGPITLEKWIEKVLPEEQDRVLEMWNRIPLKSGWFDMEFPISFDSTVHWIRKSGYFIPGENGQLSRASGVMLDITEEKYFSQRLLDSQQFFKAVIEDQTELICRIKPDGLIFFANQAFSNFFNRKSTEILNSYLKDLLPLAAYEHIFKELGQLSTLREVTNIEQLILLPGNSAALVQWTIRAIYMLDSLTEFQLVGRDNTKLLKAAERIQQSEEKYRLIAENTNDIIMMLSGRCGIEYISPSITLNLGYDPETLKGSDWKAIVIDEDIPLLETVYQKLTVGLKPELIELRMIDSQGNPKWFETLLQQQIIKGKASGKIIAISREIQNRKIAEDQQKQIESQLNEANLTKDKFFSIIAHDLRSPFTSILGFSRLLNEEYDDFTNDERKMMIKQILNSTESTFQLLDNLLAWAKTQLGKTAFNPEFFDIETFIVETINLSIPQAKIKGVSLKAIVIEKTKVYADINMIRTVLRNLLSNAIKFSYEGGYITVKASREGELIRVSIADSGTGIEDNTLKALFSLDEKVCSTKGTANEKGTGLGLILCKEFVERNGGSIMVDSMLGAGTTFSFTMPSK